MSKKVVEVKEDKVPAKNQVKNTEYIAICRAIDAVIEMGKKRTLKIMEKEVTVDAELTIPSKVGYALMKNKHLLKSFSDFNKQLWEEVGEEVREANKDSVDTEKYEKDKAYKQKCDFDHLTGCQDHPKMKAYMEDTTDEIEFYKVSLSEENLEEIDPRGVFDLTKIPEALIGTVFVWE